MIELLESGNKVMAYVTADETAIRSKLRRIREADACYFHSKQHGDLVAEHWLLHPITAQKMFKSRLVVKSPNE